MIAIAATRAAVDSAYFPGGARAFLDWNGA